MRKFIESTKDQPARLRTALKTFRRANKLHQREMAFLLGSQGGAASVCAAWERGRQPITPRVARLLEAYIMGYRPGCYRAGCMSGSEGATYGRRPTTQPTLVTYHVISRSSAFGSLLPCSKMRAAFVTLCSHRSHALMCAKACLLRILADEVKMNHSAGLCVGRNEWQILQGWHFWTCNLEAKWPLDQFVPPCGYIPNSAQMASTRKGLVSKPLPGA